MKPKARRRSRHQLRGAGIGFGAVSSGIAGELIGQLQYRPKEVVRRATGAGDDGNVALRQEILISKPAGSQEIGLLAGSDSDFITGQPIIVDGGQWMP